jgi:hypothetical protein
MNYQLSPDLDSDGDIIRMKRSKCLCKDPGRPPRLSHVWQGGSLVSFCCCFVWTLRCRSCESLGERQGSNMMSPSLDCGATNTQRIGVTAVPSSIENQGTMRAICQLHPVAIQVLSRKWLIHLQRRGPEHGWSDWNLNDQFYISQNVLKGKIYKK